MSSAYHLAATSVLLLASAASATIQQDLGKTIVVRGTRIDPAQARGRAKDFVKRTGVANGQQQVARWIVPVCIKVIGLTAPHAARFKRQMLEFAHEANVRVAKLGCEPNITVGFAADPGQVVGLVNRRKPRQLDELSPAQKEQLLHGEAPVRWWYATRMLDRDGVQSNNISAPWIASEGGVPFSLTLNDGVTATQQYNGGSNVRTPTVRSLYGATVIVDTGKAGMTSIDSVAAYAAMVAFAEMNASEPPPDSILGLFDPESGDSSLTDWDMAFLKSLYRMPLDRRSRIQRGHLVEALLDERLPKPGSTKSRK